jgi:hypothetical protein
MNWNFQEILTKDPSSAGGCDTSGNIPPCGVALSTTCRCTNQALVKNADLRHPSCTVVMYRRKSASPVRNVLRLTSHTQKKRLSNLTALSHVISITCNLNILTKFPEQSLLANQVFEACHVVCNATQFSRYSQPQVQASVSILRWKILAAVSS